MRGLTERQQELLRMIETHLSQHGYPPTIREMAEAMGIRSTNGVNDHLKALVKKGYLNREGSLKSRAISLPHRRATRRAGDSGALSVPILGRVAAGAPLLAEENLSGHLLLDPSLVGGRRGEVFALRVKGDSMIGRGILDGDTVVVRSQPTAASGQVVVALIEGEATVKVYRPGREAVVFEPANPALRPIVVRRDQQRQVSLLGVVTGVFRRLV